MAHASRFAKGNRLLQSLTASDLALLKPNLISVQLPIREELEKPKKPIENVYFFEQGIASVVAVQPQGVRVEIGIIGCEGMSGLAVVLGSDRSPHSTYMQAAGEAMYISADALRQAMGKSGNLRLHFLKYFQAFAVQTAHTAVANAKANVEQRLARWLIMSHDRVPGDNLNLTHEFLGLMLAVRRAGVTEALQALKRRGCIDTSRRQIMLVDRKRLEQVAGPFYGAPETEYHRLLG